MINTWNGVTIDCHHPERVSRFWSALLDRPEGDRDHGFIYLGTREDALPRLVFQQVAEPKRGKTRIHLDVTVADIEAGIAQVVELGGRETGERHDYDEGIVVVMQDVEDNEFCLVQYF